MAARRLTLLLGMVVMLTVDVYKRQMLFSTIFYVKPEGVCSPA